MDLDNESLKFRVTKKTHLVFSLDSCVYSSGSYDSHRSAQRQDGAVKWDGKKRAFHRPVKDFSDFKASTLKQNLFASFVVGQLVLPMARVRMPNSAEEIFNTGECLSI